MTIFTRKAESSPTIQSKSIEAQKALSTPTLKAPTGGGFSSNSSFTTAASFKPSGTGGMNNVAGSPYVDPPPPQSWPKGPLSPSQEVNPDVEVMQRRLVELGYLDPAKIGDNWGKYGDNTQAAISDFQLANGLPPTGMADTNTLYRMGSSSAKTEAEAVAALGLRSERVIGETIGVAGPSPKPTLDPNAPQQMTITSNQDVNCRASPATGTPLDQFAPGTTVTVVQPQPSGGQDGWLYVTGQGNKGAPVSGWVSTELMQPKASSDPRVDARMEALGYIAPGGTTDAEALRNFQAMNKLPATGTLDQATLDKMWSPSARQSFQIVQFHDDTYNPTKSGGGDNNCGPASVAMALASVGLASIDNADPQSLVAKIRTDSGTVAGNYTGTADLEKAAQANGAQTYRVNNMDEVKLAVMRGDPVVLYGVPNQGGTYYNSPASMGSIDSGGGHWVAVVGYDPKTDTFIVNDPLCRDGTLRLTQDQLNTYADFSVDSVAIHPPPEPMNGPR